MGRHCFVFLRRRYDVPIRRRRDASLRRLGDVPSRRRWVFHLRQRDVAATSPQRLNAEWASFVCYSWKTLFLQNILKFAEG